MNELGSVNDSVLAQEFLVGKEYIVDHVSRDGLHKLMAIWEYDKRAVNGAAFVYFGERLMRPTSTKMRTMVAYAEKVFTPRLTEDAVHN